MNGVTDFSNLVGEWNGTNRVWLSPTDPVRESPITAQVSMAAQGLFMTLRYAWADAGIPQDGLFVLGYQRDLEAATAVWIDSWHMQDKFMTCLGTFGTQGNMILLGSYAAPPGPDWGWQIDIAQQTDDALQITMHNISPEGEAMLAVETILIRRPPSLSQEA
ncbi:MAG: DUF1579 family protein [Ardenticatenaceae bacterium]|nr:DUF1579 family protein [Ardenticatenaceae bacterium]